MKIQFMELLFKCRAHSFIEVECEGILFAENFSVLQKITFRDFIHILYTAITSGSVKLQGSVAIMM